MLIDVAAAFDGKDAGPCAHRHAGRRLAVAAHRIDHVFGGDGPHLLHLPAVGVDADPVDVIAQVDIPRQRVVLLLPAGSQGRFDDTAVRIDARQAGKQVSNKVVAAGVENRDQRRVDTGRWLPKVHLHDGRTGRGRSGWLGGRRVRCGRRRSGRGGRAARSQQQRAKRQDGDARTHADGHAEGSRSRYRNISIWLTDVAKPASRNSGSSGSSSAMFR